MPYINKIRAITSLAALAVVIGFLATRYCCNSNRQKTISQSSQTTHTRYYGIGGFIEYTELKNNLKLIRIDPGTRFSTTTEYEDFNGDTLVDRIRKTQPYNQNRLLEFLSRDIDYDNHQQEFDKADEFLREEIARYDSE